MNFLAQAGTGVNIGEQFGSPFGQSKTLVDLVSLVLSSAFVLSGLLVLFLFIFAGFQIVTGAGQNNPEATAKGKKAATSAAIGFAVIFMAYWIIRIIEFITGETFITGLFFG